MSADDLSHALKELKQELTSQGEITELLVLNARTAVFLELSAMFSKHLAEKISTRRSKKKRLIFCISWSRIIRSWMEISVLELFAFVWFLRKARILDTSRMTPPALTALTLLVAESHPKEKEKMIGLVLLLLKK